MDSFSLDDYDCIGFDLDCTIAEYNLKELMKLVYDLLVQYLIEKKSYPSECFSQSYEEGEFFLLKGLIMDLKKGNVLKLGENGVVLKASHGAAMLTEKEIIEQYGEKKIFNFNDFVSDPLSVLKSPSKDVIKWTLDCFDGPCILIFARLIDYLDKSGNGELREYNVWPDILKGLYYIYNKDDFINGYGGFFSSIKKNPEKYYVKWNDEKIAWLRELKKKKFIFLLTGSFIDFATLTATTCIGENWRDYFDVVLCYAQKPYFFMNDFSFKCIKDFKETETVKSGDLQRNSIYSRGNWKDLSELFLKHGTGTECKSLYVGDNLIQDVYAPSRFKCCDTVAVCVELNRGFGVSKCWGSFFVQDENITFWNHVILSNAKICISGLDVFSKRPIDFKYSVLRKTEGNSVSESNGYYLV